MCHIGKKSFSVGATFRPDPCTNCTCQSNSTTLCHRDIHRRGCPNVHPATITVAPPALRTKATTTAEPASALAVVSIQQQEAAANANAAGPSKVFQQTPTALPVIRPLTCAYRGVTYQVSLSFSFFLLLLLLFIFPPLFSVYFQLLNHVGWQWRCPN